jgi:hypothetical protein
LGFIHGIVPMGDYSIQVASVATRYTKIIRGDVIFVSSL